jgi:hypothetical protein
MLTTDNVELLTRFRWEKNALPPQCLQPMSIAIITILRALRNVLTMIIMIILLIIMTFVVDTPPCLLMIQPLIILWPPCPPLALEKKFQFMTTICNSK